MTKVIDGKNAVLGRLASYVAKQALKGEEFAIVNCEDIIVTGNRTNIKDEFAKTRTKVGSGQKGPKVSRDNYKVVKRAIRGMIGNHRGGRGREAFKRIKCYNGIPKEFEKAEKMNFENKGMEKFIKVKEIFR